MNITRKGTKVKPFKLESGAVKESHLDSSVSVVVSGLIVMWHGTIANIPSGFVICDGNNSTPNLLDRFVQQVPTAATDPGATGGSDSKTTSGHTHTQGSSGGTVVSAHSGSKSTCQTAASGANAYTSLDDHNSHTHTNPTTNSNTDFINDIRPKYYMLAFIMKT